MALDLIEISFRVIEGISEYVQPYERWQYGITQDAQESIAELNHRFLEHDLGFRYEHGQLIQVDSEYLYTETASRAFELLSDSRFAGANDEFLSAHVHYRHGMNKESINDALKSFESTMKTICEIRSWSINPGATAKDLIAVLLDNELIPRTFQDYFAGLQKTLESGLPTIRNKMSGHGQGSQPTQVPDYLTAYALHLAASNIVMLVEAHRTMAN